MTFPELVEGPGEGGTRADEQTRGILGLPGQLPFSLRLLAPAPDLSWCVEHFWVSSWDLASGCAAVARVLPHPCVNLTLEGGQLRVTGVPSDVFTHRLVGSQSVFGVKFRPGAFRELVDYGMLRLSGARQSAHGLLPGSAQLEKSLNLAAHDDRRAEVFEDYLRGRRIVPSRGSRLVREAVSALVSDPTATRVRDVATRFGVSTRTLQRMFADRAGVSPGWVLRRGRLHAAAERVIQLAAEERPGGWAAVAAEFGYADEAHLSREFRKVLGGPPGAWAMHLVREARGG